MSESLIADADRSILETKSISVCKYASAIIIIGDAVLRVCNNNIGDATLSRRISGNDYSRRVFLNKRLLNRDIPDGVM